MNPKTFCHFCGGRTDRRELDGRPRRYCPSCDLPLYDNPVPATCVVAAAPDGRVLLVKRAVAPVAFSSHRAFISMALAHPALR